MRHTELSGSRIAGWSEVSPSAVDYCSLLARAISARDSNTAEARQTLYERARKALAEQLEVRRSGDMDSLLEQRALATAIDQIEDAAAQKTSSPDSDVEAPVQSTPDDVVDAQSALDRGDYATALKLFRPLADHERTFAETVLGYTAEQGNAIAQSILGFIHSTGTACSLPNYDEAIKWWHSAANQGEPHAQHHLGQAYGTGRGVTLDYVQAFKYLTLSSQKHSDVAGDSVEQLWALRLKMTDAELAQAVRLVKKW
jgi:TPR repeat protein